MTQGVTPYPNPRPSFEWPVTPPDSGANDGDIAVVCFSEAWRPFIVGALKQLLLQSTWQGDPDAITEALGIATDIIGQFSQETAACTEIMVIKRIRYNSETDTTQTDFGDTGSWTDNPTFDPRSGSGFLMPPRVTDDPKCDAAAGMTAAFKGFIDAGINYLQKEEMVGALVEFILLFLPEVGWLIDLLIGGAEALIAAGQTALTDDFTPTVYEQINCAIYCHINSDGTITATQLGAIIDEIGVEQITLVSVLFELFTRIVGVVGFQNAGATSTLTGDCSACDCGWCLEWDFGASGDLNGLSIVHGHYVSADGYTGDFIDGNSKSVVYLEVGSLGATVFTFIEITYSISSSGANARTGFQLYDAGTNVLSAYAGVDGSHENYAWSGTLTADYINFQLNSGTDATLAKLEHITIRGNGTPPSIGSSCP